MSSESDEIRCLEQQCKDAWDRSTRTYKQFFERGIRQIRDMVDFASASDVVKLHIAEKLIVESTAHIGSIVESGDVTWFLWNVAHEMRPGQSLFDSRRASPIKSALLLAVAGETVATGSANGDDCGIIPGGGVALAALYLVTQREFLFRAKSPYLKDDGTTKREFPQQLRLKLSLP